MINAICKDEIEQQIDRRSAGSIQISKSKKYSVVDHSYGESTIVPSYTRASTNAPVSMTVLACIRRHVYGAALPFALPYFAVSTV
jgi:hypothetical protein